MDDHKRRHAVLINERNAAEAEVKRLQELLSNREENIGALENALMKHRNGELAAQAELATAQRQVRTAREALANYANPQTYDWQVDGYTWEGGKWDYRRNPWLDAQVALAALAPDAPAKEPS